MLEKSILEVKHSNFFNKIMSFGKTVKSKNIIKSDKRIDLLGNKMIPKKNLERLASGGGTADRHIRFFSNQSLKQNHCIDTLSQICNIAFSRISI